MKHKFTFIIVTETWLNVNSDYLFELDSYKSHNIYRNNRIGGGIKVYYLGHICTRVLDDFTGSSGPCESILINANVPGCGKMMIFGIYRPPSNSVTEFISYIEGFLVSHGHNNIICVGDFNIDVLDLENRPYSRDFVNTFSSYGFTNEINKKSYVSPITDSEVSCLDHVWNNFGIERTSYVIKHKLSDHYGVATIFKNHVDNIPIKIKFRDFSVGNIQSYMSKIEDEFSSFSSSFYDANDYTNYLTSSLNRLLNKYFPIKCKIITHKRIQSPWITSKIKKCIEKKHRWYRLWKGGLITLTSYKRYCSSLRNLLRIAKKNYYVHKLNSLNNDPKKNWKLLNKMMNKNVKGIPDEFIINGSSCADPQLVANAFNTYFVDHPHQIHENIDESNGDYSNIISQNTNTMYFDFFDELEILKVICNLKKEGDRQDISRRFIKLSASYVSKLLCKLFNMCLTTSIYPDGLKIAKVTPVFKKGKNNDISNYRPVSVLCNLGKIFDSLLYNRLSNFFMSQGLLSENQYGFRKNRSTELAIFSLIDRILPAIENKIYAVCVFLDYSACFDTLSRDILISKLYRYGVRGLPLNLIKSYFADRKQYVNYKDAKSSMVNQDIGVIQGSKCGPMFYDIYSSDISQLCDSDEYLMFADDTCIIYVNENLNELIQHVNNRLAAISDWCKFNKLCLNASKCNYMLITNKIVDNDPIIYIDHDQISRVNCYKYLGVYMDDKLRYGRQIEVLKVTLSRFCGMSYRLKEHLNLKAAKNIYYSCVFSCVKYCMCIWGGKVQLTQIANNLVRLHENY